MTIIKNTMCEFGPEGVLADHSQDLNPAMDDLVQLISGAEAENNVGYSSAFPHEGDTNFVGSYDSIDYTSFDFLEDHKKIISDDALFGLFAPHQQFL